MYTRASQFVRICICITYPEPSFDTNFNAKSGSISTCTSISTSVSIRTSKHFSNYTCAAFFVCVELALTLVAKRCSGSVLADMRTAGREQGRHGQA